MPKTPLMTPSLRPTVYIAAVAMPLLVACSDAPDATPELRVPPVPVTIATVGEDAATDPVTGTGTFLSRDEIPLGFKIAGVVTRVLVDEGATVQRGQVLASLDLREIDAAVNKAQVGMDKAQRDLTRLARLAADSVATLAQLQDATSALEAAGADLAAARMNRDYAIITAPEAGTILQRLAAPGSTVGPGAPLFVLGGSRRGRAVRMGLPDRDALRVHVGDRATATFDALPGRTFDGKVVLVGRAADPRTGTYAVEVSLSGADALPSGLVGQLRITARGASAAQSVPVDALLEAERDSATVYVAEKDAAGVLRALERRVYVSQLTGDRAVVAGLKVGTPVVARGAAYVTHGTVLAVISDATLDSLVPARRDTRAAALQGGRAP
jgi:RND family efflux transporter MFP subunit